MFISGMVFSLKFHEFPSHNFSTSREIMKSVRGLLVPFLSWALIIGFINYSAGILEYFMSVIEGRNGLWFFLGLFYCRIFFVLVHKSYIKFFRKYSVISLIAFMTAAYTAALLLVPAEFTFMQIGAFRTYFPYFASGVFLYYFRERFADFLESIPFNIIILILFLILATLCYVYRFSLSEDELAEIPRHMLIILKVLTRVTAVFGTLIALSITLFIFRSNFKHVISFLAATGKMTIGIYVFHGYFCEMFPPVIFPLSVSIILTMITEKIPVVRSLLLGK